MAYTINKSDGTLLISIPDGQLNTGATSIGLPGRNYSSYGNVQDTAMVHMIEHFANLTPPPRALKGQIWFHTGTNQLYVCPTDGETNIPGWNKITTTQTGTPTPFGDVTVTGNLIVNGTGNITAVNASLTGNLFTTMISTGSNVTAGTMTGNWTLTTGSKLNATYADLAERFEADAEYSPGTVVEIGGTKEVTAVVDDLSDRVFGVVSDTAAYLMNADAGPDSTHPPIAIGGRVQVRVTGPINKGDRLVSAGSGLARAAAPGEINAVNSIGRALSSKNTSGIGMVEAIVIIR